MLDAQGKAIPSVLFQGEGRRSKETWSIVEGRSQVFAISERARSIVFLADGEELRRREITLQPGLVNIIEH
jgi:hypothetical protein